MQDGRREIILVPVENAGLLMWEINDLGSATRARQKELRMIIKGKDGKVAEFVVRFFVGEYENIEKVYWLIDKSKSYRHYTTQVLYTMPEVMRKDVTVSAVDQSLAFNNRELQFLGISNSDRVRGLSRDSVFVIENYTWNVVRFSTPEWDWFFHKHE